LQRSSLCAVDSPSQSTEEAHDAFSEEEVDENREHEARIVIEVRYVSEALDRGPHGSQEQNTIVAEHGREEGRENASFKVHVERTGEGAQVPTDLKPAASSF
jgi:hypothetical protein